METYHWIIIAVVAAIGFGIIKNLLNPPKKIEWADVPEGPRSLFEASIPGFEVSGGLHIPGARKYKLQGEYRGQEMRGEIEYDSFGNVEEIECEVVGRGMSNSGQECQLTDLPAEVITHMGELMGDDHKDFAPSRMHQGSFGEETAFEVRGTTTQWRWEFEFTASGKLIEMEKTLMAG